MSNGWLQRVLSLLLEGPIGLLRACFLELQGKIKNKKDENCGERGSNTRPSDLQSDALPTELSPQEAAPAGNRTRVCTVAGYYSTTRPLVLVGIYVRHK